MIDSHIHLSYRDFEQTFPYIAMDGKKYVILDADRDSLITEMKKQELHTALNRQLMLIQMKFFFGLVGRVKALSCPV